MDMLLLQRGNLFLIHIVRAPEPNTINDRILPFS